MMMFHLGPIRQNIIGTVKGPRSIPYESKSMLMKENTREMQVSTRRAMLRWFCGSVNARYIYLTLAVMHGTDMISVMNIE